MGGQWEPSPGEDMGDLGKASGRGATGWTGRVCFAASFFRLTRRLSNISCMDTCFCRTFSTCSCSHKHMPKQTHTHTHTHTGSWPPPHTHRLRQKLPELRRAASL